MQIGFNSQTAQQVGGIAFGVPPFHFGKFRFELCSPVSVFFAKIGFGINGILFLHDAPQFLVPHHYRIEYRKGIELVVVLFENRHPFAGRNSHFAGAGVDFARKNFQKGGLSGAVRPNNPIAVARGEFQVNFVEQGTLSVAERKVGYGNHDVN